MDQGLEQQTNIYPPETSSKIIPKATMGRVYPPKEIGQGFSKYQYKLVKKHKTQHN